MIKTFGQSEISRQLFADMPYPICVKNLTDEQMEELAKNVERDVIQEYPDMAEKMFTLWRVGVYDDEEMDFLEKESPPAKDLWLDLLQWYAINKYDAKYCLNEMTQYDKPTNKDMENTIEYIDMISAEYKEAADMMEETKRRAKVVELAEKLWLHTQKDLGEYPEYSYYGAFIAAETFIKLKSKYLKEGKL